jgi:hypothetical protein
VYITICDLSQHIFDFEVISHVLLNRATVLMATQEMYTSAGPSLVRRGGEARAVLSIHRGGVAQSAQIPHLRLSYGERWMDA